MRLGEEYMDADKRRDLLLEISNGRQKEARVIEVTSSLPTWVQRPFKNDQENFDQQLKIYKDNAAAVQALDQRLSQAQGPIWKDITPEEETALANWAGSLDRLNEYASSYFPSSTQQYIAKAALIAIAVGSFVLPLFLSTDEPKLPFKISPPGLPPSIRPSEKRLPAPGRPPALQVKAEPFRPSVTPMRRLPGPVAEAQPGTPAPSAFRTFARPLGPSMPVSAAAAATSGMPMTPVSSPHGPRMFPRYRRPE